MNSEWLILLLIIVCGFSPVLLLASLTYQRAKLLISGFQWKSRGWMERQRQWAREYWGRKAKEKLADETDSTENYI